MIATVADQGISTATNAGLLIAVSTQATAAEFGEFALAYGVLAFALGLQRAGIADPLLVHADESGTSQPAQTAQFVRNVAASSVLSSALLAGTGVLVGGVLGAFLVALGQVSWAVLAQDGLRFYAMARARPSVAAVMDGAWMASFAGGVLLAAGPDGADAVRIWGLGAFVGLVLGLVVLRPPGLRQSARLADAGGWMRMSFGLEFVVVTLGGLILLTGLRVVIGPEATAAIAAVVAVFQPAHSLLAGLRLFYLPRLRSRLGQPSYRPEITRWGAVIVAVLLAWLGACWLARDVLDVLLGDTWAVARPVLLAGALFEVCNGIGALRSDHLKVSNRGRTLVTGRIAFVGLFLLAALVGGLLDDVEGAAAGRAIGAAVGLAIWMALTPQRPVATAGPSLIDADE